MVLASVIMFFTVLPYGAAVVLDALGSDLPGSLPLFILALALGVPLYWRRTHPLPAAAVMVVACLIQLFTGTELIATQVAVLVMIAALAAYAPRWASWWGLGLGLGGITALGIQFWIVGQSPRPWVTAIFTVILGGSLVAVAWLTGDLTRSRRLERDAFADRARRLEKERERELQLAASDERARIAREMHDIVAHSLSIIVTQADGARYAAPASAGPVLPSLEAIAETARSSLADMRRLLGVLRDDDAAPTAPASGLADIDALIATVRSSGLPVTRLPDRGRHRPSLPQGAELVLFRVVQESLTNVLKHAGENARATVAFEWQPTAVQVRISDDGRGLHPDSEIDAGHGLQGMRERVALYEGELVISSPGEGVAVTATLPYPSDAVPESPTTPGDASAGARSIPRDPQEASQKGRG